MSDDKPNISPSRWWYLAGVLIWFGGCGATVGVGLKSGADRVVNMNRLVIPGKKHFDLVAGEYTGFYEVRSIVDGAVYEGPDGMSGVRCGAINLATGSRVSMEPAGASTNYNFGSYAGASIFKFTIPITGRYVFGCTYEGDPIVIAVDQGVGTLVGSIAAAAGGAFAVGAIIIIVVYVKRRRSVAASNSPS